MPNLRFVCVRAVVLLVGLTTPLARASAQRVLPPRWRGTIELTIGGADADDNASFGRISGLAVDATGRVFVADAQDQQIRVFSSTGASVARIGRNGSGPLEFKRLATIAFGPDRLLWARDEGNARMLGIDVSATPVRGVKNVPLTSFTGGSRLPITFDPSGLIIDETSWFDPSTTSFRPVRVGRNASGAITRSDTLDVPPGASAGVHKVTRVEKDAKGNHVGTSQRYFWQPFGPQWIRQYGPGGLRADVVTSRYEVRIFDERGTRLRTLLRTVPAVPLSARERVKADSSISELQVDLPFGVPSAKSPIVGLTYAKDGRLWVERAVADGRPREADVYDSAGRLIAVAEWPRAIDMFNGHPSISGNTLTTVATDTDGVERVVRLRFR
ncbi:6-bladed beta-propeller [Gemmatimonas sp.]|uniref:6-bladed beta-propeller n=1 Tax=Gemmatimonas sp. TaxID=1962908 RepID=UPI0039833C12